MKNIAIVILNYRGWEDTIECLESLQKVDYPDYTAIVVDNGSSDGSLQMIQEWANGDRTVESDFIKYSNHNKPLHIVNYLKKTTENNALQDLEQELSNYPPNKRLVVIDTGENLGFSGGNNVGARYAVKQGYKYILLLNNDTVIVDKEFLTKTVRALDTNQSCKVVGPKIIDLAGNFDGPYIYESYFGELFLLTIKNQLRKMFGCQPVYIDMRAVTSAHPAPVYKISGACMTFDADFLHKINYLDENVWLSCEEAIVAEKVLAHDKRIFFQPLTLLIHKKARSPRPKNSRIAILRNHFKQRQYFLRTYRKYGKLKMIPIKIMHGTRLFIELIIGKIK